MSLVVSTPLIDALDGACKVIGIAGADIPNLEGNLRACGVDVTQDAPLAPDSPNLAGDMKGSDIAELARTNNSRPLPKLAM